jgi:hypothetical protein
MPPLPVSVVALPGAFISAILGENDFTEHVNQQKTLLATSFADRETAFSCIQQIDVKIRNVKVRQQSIYTAELIHFYRFDSLYILDRSFTNSS